MYGDRMTDTLIEADSQAASPVDGDGTYQVDPTTSTTTGVSFASPSRVLLLGDVHGELGWLKVACRKAVEQNCSVILQVGDFGFWPHYSRGREFLKRAEDLLTFHGLTLWWVDGNHENHDWLNLQTRVNGFWEFGRIVHAGRGARWTWQGVTFLACGGAYSVDKPRRVEGESWWAGETITEADLVRCLDGPPVDVIVAHDAPWGAANVMGPRTVGDKDSYPKSEANRRRVAALCDALTPDLLVHGHYHHRNTTKYNSTVVEGFGRDGDPESMAVLTLPGLSIQ